MTKKQMISWCIELLEKSRSTGVSHSFCLDFASALLANLLHAGNTLEALESDERQATATLGQLLGLIGDERRPGAAPAHQLPTSTTIHCLICLSYLSKERFSQSIEKTDFVDRIGSFVEVFSQR